jgi:ribosomal protein S18 acetylase RimI-like enzyme
LAETSDLPQHTNSTRRLCMQKRTGIIMTSLSPMRAEEFPAYRENAIAGYAEDCVASHRWPSEGSIERSRADFDNSLPQGIATPDNYLYEIWASESEPTVGVLWFAIEEKNGLRKAFVYDIEIKPEHRRQGHARQAFVLLEPIVSALALDSIGLHVFSQNRAAQALYEKLGYVVTGINMQKRLGRP